MIIETFMQMIQNGRQMNMKGGSTQDSIMYSLFVANINPLRHNRKNVDDTQIYNQGT